MNQHKLVTGKLKNSDIHIPRIKMILIIMGAIAGIRKWPTEFNAPAKRALLEIKKIKGIRIWSMGIAAQICSSENPGAINFITGPA